ncbi:hypothetical protein N7448_004579 [Penicillium atrosanguineum]|nr:hypothetical protein N7448_004579 [Penicillium atrosanguineum]
MSISSKTPLWMVVKPSAMTCLSIALKKRFRSKAPGQSLNTVSDGVWIVEAADQHLKNWILPR